MANLCVKLEKNIRFLLGLSQNSGKKSVKSPKRIKVDANRNSIPIQIVRRLLVSGAVENATEANKVLREAHQINVSNQTIRRCLKESGMKAKTKVKKPLLSAKHRATRLKFAKEHAYWSAEQWRLVTWSDETNRLIKLLHEYINYIFVN